MDEAVVQDLYEHLRAEFGATQVFMDIRNIHEGEDWLDAVRDEIESCHAVLVVMAPGWLQLDDGAGGRKIDHPEDPVRLELEITLDLQGKWLVIPVFVEGGEMPPPRELPVEIRRLAYRRGHHLPARRFAAAFHTEIDELICRLVNPPEPHFATWPDIKAVAAPLPLLMANALLRPVWSTILLRSRSSSPACWWRVHGRSFHSHSLRGSGSAGHALRPQAAPVRGRWIADARADDAPAAVP